MDKQQEKSRIKKWIAGYLTLGAVMFIAIFAVHWLFIIPTAVFEFIVFRMFKDIKNLEENDVQEVVNDNLEEKQINQEVKMEMSNEEKALLLEVLSKDEELNAFLKVTNGQAKFALFEKLRKEVEAKPAEKPKEEKGKGEAEKDSKGEEDIVVEE